MKLQDLAESELSLAERLSLRPDSERELILKDISDEAMQQLLFDWSFWGRPDQQWPDGDWSILAFIGGRGSGKTLAGAHLMHEAVRRSKTPIRMALFAPTPAEARDLMIEGESGIMHTAAPSELPLYEAAKRRLTWPGGSWATIYTGADPDSGRGPNLHFAWLDELAKFKYMQKVWDNFRGAIRAGDDPKTVITTTPKPLPLIKRLVNRELPGTLVRRVSTFRNIANLAESFIAEMSLLEGTTLGRQELYGEILEDVEGAMWSMDLIEGTRIDSRPRLARIAVGVDPSNASTIGEIGTGRECGIVVCAKGSDGRGYVLDDRSLHATPSRWGMEAALAYLEHEADALVIEMNFGAATLRETFKTVTDTIARILAGDIADDYEERVAGRLEALGPKARTHIHIVEVQASRGKKIRAEPIVGLYEQRRISHLGIMSVMEAQMTTWVPPEQDPEGKGTGYSPDRIDALVWALTHLMLGPQGQGKVYGANRVLADPLRRRT